MTESRDTQASFTARSSSRVTLALTIWLTLGLYFLGTVIAYSLGGEVGADPFTFVMGIVLTLGWQVILWPFAVLRIESKSANYTPSVKAKRIIWAAPLATAIGVVFAFPMVIFTPALLLVSGFFWLPGMISFTACAAIGYFSAVAMMKEPQERSQMIWTVVTSVLLAVGVTLASALILQSFRVYFTIGTQAEVPTPAEGNRYLWTAGMAIAALVTATLVAIIRRRGTFVVLGVILLACALLFALIFQVPQGRFFAHDTDSAPTHKPHPVCFGEGPNCPGG